MSDHSVLSFCRLVGKVNIFFWILHFLKIKYTLLLAFLLCLTLDVVAQVDSLATSDTLLVESVLSEISDSLSLPSRSRGLLDDAMQRGDADSLSNVDTMSMASMFSKMRDSLPPQPRPRGMLDDVMRGSNTDSLIYSVADSKIYAYTNGVVSYQDKTLKADNMHIDLELSEVLAYGREVDSLNGLYDVVQPEFIDGGSSYKIDTIIYNIKSERAKIKGVATQEGDGWLVGNHVKKMEDNTINLLGGKYTTCDHLDHPHFYLSMSKAKVIPGNKVVTGGAHLVIEDVHIPFLGIPEGFFPLSAGPKSGLLMPSYGEESVKGFFLKDLGYYFVVNDHVDLTLLTGIYSLGSWEASTASRYVKNYKYSGNTSLYYSAVKTGDKGEADYIQQNTFKVVWSHTQDPKANPGTSFSASVNLTSSGYTKYSATTLDDILATQTNSSISYSKSWSGTPFSLSSSLSVSQNSQSETISVTFPTMVFNVSRFYPLKSKTQIGDSKWYENISMTYTGQLTNSVSTTEAELFTQETLNNMKNGISHSVPVSASFTAFNYLNITPSISYAEKWYFKREMQEWDDLTNEIITLAPEYGFYRLYNYSTSLSSSTTLYGMYQATKPTNPIQAIRHTMAPTFGFSFAPDFSRQQYGYYQTVQSDSLGTTKTYSPYSNNAYGVPSSGRSLSMNFGLSQTLEMKVLSKQDTSGVRKISLIDNVSISGSYNFLADSMRLSTIPLSIRTTLFNNFALSLSATLDPYRVTPQGVRYDKLFFPGRITSTGWSFGYTFKSKDNNVSNANTLGFPSTNPYLDANMSPELRRAYMTSCYYDFSVPWNFGFNYAVNYGVSYLDNGTTGYEPNITQSVTFNGSATLTSKTSISFTSGYDIANRDFTTTSVSISRDLHCWQMSMSWIPFGYYRSWSFNIGVKAASLADLKYDKSQSMYDSWY